MSKVTLIAITDWRLISYKYYSDHWHYSRRRSFDHYGKKENKKTTHKLPLNNGICFAKTLIIIIN